MYGENNLIFIVVYMFSLNLFSDCTIYFVYTGYSISSSCQISLKITFHTLISKLMHSEKIMVKTDITEMYSKKVLYHLKLECSCCGHCSLCAR